MISFSLPLIAVTFHRLKISQLTASYPVDVLQNLICIMNHLFEQKRRRDVPVIFHLSYCINSLLHLIKASLTVQFVSVIVFFQFNFCNLNKNDLRHSDVFYISTASAHVDLALQ